MSTLSDSDDFSDGISISSAQSMDAQEATSQEARAILSHLLSTLQDPKCRYYPRYSEWIRKHDNLEEFIFSCLRKEVLTYLRLGTGNANSLVHVPTLASPFSHSLIPVSFNSIPIHTHQTPASNPSAATYPSPAAQSTCTPS